VALHQDGSAVRRAFVPLSEGGERLAYLFPFAGGSASAYRPYAKLFGPAYSVRAAQLPGRQNRLDDPPFTRMADLVSVLADEVMREHGRQMIFFGHSFGALVAFELTRELRRRQAELPMIVGVSGAAGPPMVGRRRKLLASQSDRDLLHAMQKMGGFPGVIAEHPDLVELVVQAVRTDLVVENAYTYSAERPLESPISIFGGDRDDILPTELDSWREVTTGRTTLRVYAGGHFYLWDHAESVIAALLSDLGDAQPAIG
jgi:medium-chain acyl-[acyl-carrier-protein] hydrolase